MPGTIRKRGKESWEVRIDVGRDPESGRRKFRYETIRGTRRQAEQALTERLHRRDTGIDIAPDKITVAEYFDRWLNDYVRVNVAPSTQRRYEQILARLKPHLGPLRLQDLRPAHIQATYGRLLAEKLAPRTVLHHHRVLREAPQHAMRWQFIARNPADAVTAPRAERFEMRALDATEVHRLLDTCDDGQLKTIIFTAVSTGMRQGSC